MSYDLYFYKKKNSQLTEQQIVEYLTKKIGVTSENNKQWFVEDEDTEVYFSFKQNEPDADDTSEFDESYPDFDNTNFTFNLNYLRPDFFGRYAFEFVDKLINELDLYVINDQKASDVGSPIKPKDNELYENWSELNAKYSSHYFKESNFIFYPLEKSNYFYNYNKNRAVFQEKLGENYFVPKIYLFEQINNGELITLCSWTQYIPNVFPKTDYILIIKKYKKLFRTVKEIGLISYASFNERFGSLLDNYDFEDCKIIHPHNAEKAKELFNSTKIEYNLNSFAKRAETDKMVNAKPND